MRRLNAAFGAVITALNAAALQEGRQRGPLVLEIVQCNPTHPDTFFEPE